VPGPKRKGSRVRITHRSIRLGRTHPVIALLIEQGGNDEGFIEPLDAAGNPMGAPQAFAKTDWKKPGFKIDGQDAGAIVILAQSPIFGIRVLPPTGGVMGFDPAIVAGVPAQ
jgi:hypothetical protein